MRINFDSRGEISVEKAIVALESLLALNGVSVIPEGDDFLKAIVSGYATSEAPPLYVDSVQDLPQSERFIARLFRFQNINVSSVETLMRNMVTYHRGGSLQMFTTANSILVTDSLTNIQRIEKLIETLDVPGQVLIYNLDNVTASEIAKQLQALQQAGLKNMLQGDVGISSNDATNQLIIVTSAANKEIIDGLISKIDVETVPIAKSKVFPLKHADADNVAAALKGVIEGSRPNTSGTSKTASVTIIGDGSTSSGTSSSGTSSSSRSSSSSSGGNSGGGARSYSLGNETVSNLSAYESDGNASAGAGTADATYPQRFSDYLTIIGDTRANSIIVIGTNSDIRQIEDIIEKIDVSLPQVRIEAIIVEVVIDEGDISGLSSFGFGYKLSPTGTVNTLTGNYRLSASAPSDAFSFEGSLKDLALELVLNQAKTNNKTKVLSSPTIMTMHNQTAQIVISEQRPFITGSTTDSTSLNTSSQVSYKDIGLELEVTPRIGANGTVQMDVSQTIDNLIGTTTIDGNEQPIVSSRRATSYVSVKDREIVVLAGLQSFDELNNNGSVYLLGDLPLIGWLFRPKNYSSTKRELIVFLRPYIVSDETPEEILGTGEDALTRDDARFFIENNRFLPLINPEKEDKEEEKEEEKKEEKKTEKKDKTTKKTKK